MPKIYTENEKAKIKKKLKEVANELMQEKGVKKTTVDELVQKVGIPKGTFYLFYPSKELLLYDVIMDFHKQVDEFMEMRMTKLVIENHLDLEHFEEWKGQVEEITDIIFGAMELTYHSCLSVVLKPENMQLILDKLPNEVVMAHKEEDKEMGAGAFQVLAQMKGISVEALVGSFTAILFGGMYRREIGEANWEESIRGLIRGLVLQLIG